MLRLYNFQGSHYDAYRPSYTDELISHVVKNLSNKTGVFGEPSNNLYVNTDKLNRGEILY